MKLWKWKNKKGDKVFYYYDYGRGKGQRPPTGLFTYTKPKDQMERNHNKETKVILALKEAEATLEQQSIGTGYIPTHKLHANFLSYYEEYVKLNKRPKNRHLQGSLNHFKAFLGCDILAPIDITHNLSTRFRQYLLDRFNGETPANYFSHYKEVIKAATRDGYFRIEPTEKVAAKSNPSTTLKEFLEVDEYLQLLNTPFFNRDIAEGYITSCYNGLRYVDVEDMSWKDIKEDQFTTRIIQSKTGHPVVLTLHPVVMIILNRRRQRRTSNNENEKIFNLPTNDGCNKEVQKWVDAAKIKKHITWSSARLMFSILLQDEKVDDATIAYLLGHTTTKQVQKTYKRHRPKDQSATIAKLPAADPSVYFLRV